MPAKMLTRIARRSGRTGRGGRRSATRWGEAPPPTSRKFAGSPPACLIMSMVAMARPAPLTMQPISPSRRYSSGCARRPGPRAGRSATGRACPRWRGGGTSRCRRTTSWASSARTRSSRVTTSGLTSSIVASQSRNAGSAHDRLHGGADLLDVQVRAGRRARAPRRPGGPPRARPPPGAARSDRSRRSPRCPCRRTSRPRPAPARPSGRALDAEIQLAPKVSAHSM